MSMDTASTRRMGDDTSFAEFFGVMRPHFQSALLELYEREYSRNIRMQSIFLKKYSKVLGNPDWGSHIGGVTFLAFQHLGQ